MWVLQFSVFVQQTVQRYLSVFALGLLKMFHIRLFKFQEGGLGGIKNLTALRFDPPSQNPPPGVRCEGILRKDEKRFRIPNYRKVKKKDC